MDNAPGFVQQSLFLEGSIVHATSLSIEVIDVPPHLGMCIKWISYDPFFLKNGSRGDFRRGYALVGSTSNSVTISTWSTGIPWELRMLMPFFTSFKRVPKRKSDAKAKLPIATMNSVIDPQRFCGRWKDLTLIILFLIDIENFQGSSTAVYINLTSQRLYRSNHHFHFSSKWQLRIINTLQNA